MGNDTGGLSSLGGGRSRRRPLDVLSPVCHPSEAGRLRSSVEALAPESLQQAGFVLGSFEKLAEKLQILLEVLVVQTR